ncbi:unnamed protein product [Musa hybrid cultivar]
MMFACPHPVVELILFVFRDEHPINPIEGCRQSFINLRFMFFQATPKSRSIWGFPSPSGFCRKGSTKSSSRRWKETFSPKLARFQVSTYWSASFLSELKSVFAGVMEGMLKPSEECPISNTRAVPPQVFESTSSILKPSVVTPPNRMLEFPATSLPPTNL